MRLSEKAAPRRSLDIVFRVYDDGVGFRYEFPDQQSLRQDIADELTEFNVADPATAWWTRRRMEPLRAGLREDPAGRDQPGTYPATIKTDQGLYVAFHEAALADYSAMWLRRVDRQRLKATLSPSSTGPRVSRTAPFPTPWRTMQIADSAPGLYMSDLELNLNEPNKLGDVSWLKPLKYIGIWWGMHLGEQSWSSGPTHGTTTARARQYIDFAAANGFKGVLIEGWNQGWDGDWFGNGEKLLLHQGLSRFRPQGGDRLWPLQGRGVDRPP